MQRAVTKSKSNGTYGRTNVPARGEITLTKPEDGRLRITPSAPGIPAQAYVRWADGEETWERRVDLS